MPKAVDVENITVSSVAHVTIVAPQMPIPITPLVWPSPSSGVATPLPRSQLRTVPRRVPVASSYEPVYMAVPSCAMQLIAFWCPYCTSVGAVSFSLSKSRSSPPRP